MKSDYDGRARVVGTTHRKGGVIFDEQTYAWDAVSNKTNRTEWDGAAEVRSVDYEYDALDRLIRSTTMQNGALAGIAEYDLDGTGNREQVTGGPAAGNYELLSPVGVQTHVYAETPFDTHRRMYDRAGNYLGAPVGEDGVRYGYQVDGRLAVFERVDGGASTTAATYRYDPLGRRIEKTVTDASGSVTTRYGYNGERVVEEFTTDGTLQAEYVYGTYLDEVVLMVRGGQAYYYHADDQYNVVKVTNSSGAVVEAYDYGDYGAPEFYDAAGNALPASTLGNPFLFTGRQWVQSPVQS